MVKFEVRSEFDMNVHPSRFEKQNKKRKTNFILNIFIIIVFALIVIIGSQLLFGDRKEETQSNNETNQTQSVTTADSVTEKEREQEQTEEEQEANAEETSLEEVTVTEGEPNSNIEKVIENNNWEPIGTEQTGEHSATYEKGSVDWNEMVRAISYATGLSEEEFTLWRLENNGSPQDAKGTIENKKTGERLVVYITWVDQKGWKPTKVEVLK